MSTRGAEQGSSPPLETAKIGNPSSVKKSQQKVGISNHSRRAHPPATPRQVLGRKFQICGGTDTWPLGLACPIIPAIRVLCHCESRMLYTRCSTCILATADGGTLLSEAYWRASASSVRRARTHGCVRVCRRGPVVRLAQAVQDTSERAGELTIVPACFWTPQPRAASSSTTVCERRIRAAFCRRCACEDAVRCIDDAGSASPPPLSRLTSTPPSPPAA